MAKLFGKASVAVDGTQLLNNNDAKLSLGGVNRNVVKGNKVYGYAEEAMEATVDVTVYIGADTDLVALNNITDSTVTFSLDSGQRYVLAHAFVTKPIDVSAATNGGTATLSLAAPQAVQL